MEHSNMLMSALSNIIGKLDKLTGMMPKNAEEKPEGVDQEIGETPEHEASESPEFEAGENEEAKESGMSAMGDPWANLKGEKEEPEEMPEEEENGEQKPAHIAALEIAFKKKAK